VHAYRAQGVVVATVGTLAIEPGQVAVFDTHIVNDSGHPVRVTGARVATVPGRRKAKLTNVALVTGRNAVGIRTGPPTVCACGHWPGTTCRRGAAHIAVGITGSSPGNYLAAGVTFIIRDRGGRHQATAWGGGVPCVVWNINAKKPAAECDRASDSEIDQMDDFIHQQ
jgi:hypothetical protein